MRLKILRENNFDDWLQLINFSKNKRLLEILNQTNKYIEELGQKVSVQKGQVSSSRKGGKKKKGKGGADVAAQDEESDEDAKEADGEGNEGKDENDPDFDNMDEND